MYEFKNFSIIQSRSHYLLIGGYKLNILIAPDSFKGSLSAEQVALTMKQALEEEWNHLTIQTKPMADGGEGTIDAILAATKGKRIHLTTSGPLGEPIDTSYARLSTNTAIIETAMHAGLYQISEDKRNPYNTTTYGIGEAILHALDQGCKKIIVALGGSATNDGGLGMLRALGMEAYDEENNLLQGFGRDLLLLHRLSFDKLDKRLNSVELQIACDVDNPLCGPTGASTIYGPQKGATPEQVEALDRGLSQFATLVQHLTAKKYHDIPGAGAAGGLGFAFLLLGAKLIPGAKLVADTIDLVSSVKDADLIFTGEGQSDYQTLFGKAPGYVASLAEAYQVPIILLSGSLGDGMDQLREKFAGCFSITNRPMSLDECMNETVPLLKEQTKQIFSLFQTKK